MDTDGDGLDAARGCVLAVPIGLVLWAVIIYIVRQLLT